MGLLTIIVNVTALAFGLTVCAFLAMLVVAFGFLGVLITGLVVLVIAYTIELEDGSALGHPQNPELLPCSE